MRIPGRTYHYLIAGGSFLALHALLLFGFGISAITTTLCFYGVVLVAIMALLSLVRNAARRRLILYNAAILLGLLFLLEFALTYVFPLNTTGDDFRGVYHMLHKRQAQEKLYRSLGLTPPSYTLENGQLPGTEGIHETPEFRYPVKYNELGLRGQLPDLVKPDSVFRIVVLGDSFAEGYGTPDDSTFAVMLQHYLGPNAQVINGGMCGSNPLYSRMLYWNKLEGYRPDLVILEVNVCDLADFKVAALQPGRIGTYMIAISHIYRFFVLGSQFERLIMRTDNAGILEDQSTQIRALIAEIRDFEAGLKSKGSDMLVLYLPWLPELPGDANNPGFSGAFRDSLLASGLPLIDLYGEYRSFFDTSGVKPADRYWKNDHHHDHLGYQMMAEIVSKKIKGLR